MCPALCCLIGASLNSCMELDDSVYTTIVSDKYHYTEKDMVAILGNAYTPWRSVVIGAINETQTISTDETMIPVHPWGWNGTTINMHLHTWTSETGEAVNRWGDLYTGINNANQVIYQIESGLLPVTEGKEHSRRRKSDMAKTAVQPKTMESNHKVASVLSTGLFAILCVLIAFPLLAGFFASFQEGREVVMKGMSLNLDFSKMHLDNYKYLFSGNEDSRKYFMWYKNSLILTLITVALTLLVCYFIAYGLTMYKFKLQGFLFFLVIATMCVPFEILMLPLYNEVTSLGIINTRAGVILPGLCGASTIFFFKQYMQSLPKELLDAGRIDGCTEYGISVKIMMPITKPAFASMAILCAMGSWNNMLWPMLVFRDTSKFTLQIGLNTLLTPYGNNYNLLIAGSMFGILPILIIYLIFQRYLIDGMTSGAVKG